MANTVGIIGGNSQIYKKFIEHTNIADEINFVSFGKKLCNFELNLANRLDEEEIDSLLNLNRGVKQFIFFAGITKPDECANNAWESFRVNVLNMIAFISKCIEHDKEILFLSSDAVFEGSKYPSYENSLRCPKYTYGIQKSIIEEYFCQYKNFKTVRLSYVLCRNDSIFKHKMYNDDYILYRNFMRNVIPEDHVYCILEKYIHKFHYLPQILNAAGDECLSKFDIGNMVSKVFHSSKPIAVDAEDNFFVNRAKKIEMKSSYISDVLGYKPTKIINWIEQIKETENG